MDIEYLSKIDGSDNPIGVLMRREFADFRDWKAYRYASRALYGQFVPMEGFVEGTDGWMLRLYSIRLGSIPVEFPGWNNDRNGWRTICKPGVKPMERSVVTYFVYESFKYQATYELVTEWGVSEVAGASEIESQDAK